jgi:hypothetical protein
LKLLTSLLRVLPLLFAPVVLAACMPGCVQEGNQT